MIKNTRVKKSNSKTSTKKLLLFTDFFFSLKSWKMSCQTVSVELLLRCRVKRGRWHRIESEIETCISLCNLYTVLCIWALSVFPELWWMINATHNGRGCHTHTHKPRNTRDLPVTIKRPVAPCWVNKHSVRDLLLPDFTQKTAGVHEHSGMSKQTCSFLHVFELAISLRKSEIYFLS